VSEGLILTAALPGALGGKVSLVERAMAHVRDYIRNNDLKVGDPLPGEGKFAAELQVSRAVMREAFGSLAALRQIDVSNGRRARVAAIDGSVMALSLDHAVATAQVSVIDVWDVRRTLELRTVELAAQNRSDAQARQIVAAARAMRDVAPDLDRLSSADVDFHHAIAEASGNPLFHQIVRSFERLMDIAVPRAWQTRLTEDQRIEMLDLHQEIAQAIADRDGQRAMAGMDRHFDTSIADLMRSAAQA
jgi:GntR family transcriptional regulator, transcriptional repressor for pyruvate dehydrogenase complex